MTDCLDSWAVLAWLDGDEPASEVVQRSFDSGRPTMSWISLIEVEYTVRLEHGSTEAAATLSQVRKLVIEDLPGVTCMRSVAALKADHAIALADCFAIATAAASGSTLITGDPEMVDAAERLPCRVKDARVPPDA